MTYFLHELLNMATHIFFKQKMHHNGYIGRVSFFHELILYVSSNILFEKSKQNNHYIWVASFFHELIYYEIVCGETCITIVTFEWLLSFMNWFNISYLLWEKDCRKINK